MENPIKMDDLGGTIIFGNTHLSRFPTNNALRSGGQWRDDFREDVDEGRGGKGCRLNGDFGGTMDFFLKLKWKCWVKRYNMVIFHLFCLFFCVTKCFFFLCYLNGGENDGPPICSTSCNLKLEVGRGE